MRNPSNLDEFTDVWLTHLSVGGTIIVAAHGAPGDLITLTYLGAGSWGDIVESDYIIVGSTDVRIAAMLDAVDETAGDVDGLTLWLARGQYVGRLIGCRGSAHTWMCTAVRMDHVGAIWVDHEAGSVPECEIVTTARCEA